MEQIKQKKLEELILLGIKGVHFVSYADTNQDRYFSIKDMCTFTKDIHCLNDFEMNYGVYIINLVLDGEE